MASHRWIWLLAVLVISGCATARTTKQSPQLTRQTLMDVYAESVGQSRRDMNKFIEQKLTEQNTYGYVKPYVPVVEGPLVRKVWVPDQKSKNDPDVLVAGHWTYVMVRGPKWFIDSEEVDEAPAEILVPKQPIIQDVPKALIGKKGGQ